MRDEEVPYPSEPEYILRETLQVCTEIQEYLNKVLAKAPETARVKISHSSKPAENPTRVFDSEAEEWFRTHIQNVFSNVEVMGEEDPRLPTANFQNALSTTFLVDMVDGSDLFMNGLGNWCSAVICFSPPRRHILAAVVAHSNGNRYFANADGASVDRVINPGSPGAPRRRMPLHVNKAATSMSKARLCCYGQKWKKILLAPENFYRALGEGGRFYNLAGNPMMARLAEGKIDAVFEVGGQAAYDVIPGAYIAMKAGAVMSTLQGELITESSLFERLLVPANELQYVLAATEELRSELCSKLAGAETLGCHLTAV